MADTTLSALTATSTLAGTDELYVNDGGVSRKVLFSVLEGQLDHDSLGGVTASEHLDWTASAVGTVKPSNISSTSITQHVASIDHNALSNHTATEHYTWASSIVPNVHASNIPEGAVTQHEGAIDHNALTNHTATEHYTWAVSIVSNVHASNIPEGAVTQHEGAIDHNALTNHTATEHYAWATSIVPNVHASNLQIGVAGGTQGYDTELAAIAGLTSATNKIPRFTASGAADLIDFLDEDNMASDSNTGVPSQQSVKAYVDTNTLTWNDAATTAPTATDDSTPGGYAVNSVWTDVTNDRSYICVDATNGAAVWRETSFVPATINDLATVTGVSGDFVIARDATDGALKKINVGDFLGGGGANTDLGNLAAVAINTSLISDTDVTDDLGSAAIRWNNIYAAAVTAGDTVNDTLKIQARDVDGAAQTTFITLTSSNTPTCDLAGDVTKGGSTILTDVVQDTTPQLGGDLDANGSDIQFDDATGIRDDSDNEQLIFQKTASAVNHLEATNAATGNGPSLAAVGDDANVDLTISAKGTGDITLGVYTFDGDQTVGAGQDNYVLTYDNGTGLVSLEAAAGGGLSDVVDDTTPQLGGDLDANAFDIQFDDATGIRDDSDNEQLIFQKTASAVNHFEMTNAATGNDPQLAAVGGDTNIDLNLVAKGSGVVQAGGVEVTTISGTQTLTNKRVNPRESTIASATNITMTSDSSDIYTVTAQAVNPTIKPPSGTPVDGQSLILRLKDNGTARTITWDTTTASGFRASSDLSLPTTTVISKTMYCGFRYNSDDTQWDFVSYLDNF